MNVIEKYIAQQKAILHKTQSISEMAEFLVECQENECLVSESDGQFTGGYYHEMYQMGGKYYEFLYHEGDLEKLTIYDEEIYEGKK